MSRALARALTVDCSNPLCLATPVLLGPEHANALAAVDGARRRLADRTVRAPFRGVLGLTSVDLGARVDDETVLTTIDDLSEVEIQFSLPEMVYGQVRIGQEVQAGAAAFSDRTFDGDVVAIDSRIDATSRAFRARARLPNPERLLPAGMFVHLVLELDARRGVTVPEEAIAVEGGASFVFVVADGKAERRRVTLGKRTVGRVEIADGVAVGDQVVVAGLQSLRDGSPVEVRAPVEGEGVGTAVAPAPSERS
jgi:membrane fusion protein (multidrug efflux system)